MKAREVQRNILQAIDNIQETSSQGVRDAQIAERLGLDVQEVQDHLDLMAEEGYVKLAKTFGPSYSAWLTPRGRIALREEDHVAQETFSATRSSQPADRSRESSTPYSAPPQEGRPPSESFASLMREIERIQKIVDHNLQLKLDDTPQLVREMPVTAFETAFRGERRPGVSEELLLAVDDYLDFAASINSLVDRYENQIRSGRDTAPVQMGVPGSSLSSYTIQQIQEEITKQKCIEDLKQHIEELERSQRRAEESMPEATREAPSTFQSTPSQEMIGEKQKPIGSPWTSGSFYLFAAVVLIVVLIIALVVVRGNQNLPWYTLPIVLIFALLMLTVIGALQLRSDESLSEENFLKLMIETLRRLPLLRGDKPLREREGSESQEEEDADS